MNLAIVSPYPPDITGIGQYGFHVGRALARSGHFSRVSVLSGARTQALPEDHPASLNVIPTWRPGDYRAGLAISAGLSQLKPDLAWFNLGASVFGRSPLANLLGLLSLYQVGLSGLPTVVTLHELVELTDLKTLKAPGGRLALLGARLLTHLATRCDVVCFTMRRYVNWFSARRPGQACVHIPIGAYQTPERLPEPASHPPELLFFTTLAPYKGLEVLLSAYSQLLPRYPELRLAIAGAEHPRFPGYRQALQGQFAHLPGVDWHQQVSEAELRGLFARSQVVVLPYLASTGSSSVIYQAAMWGRPVAVSNLPEIRTVAEEGGLRLELFETRDITQLVRALQTLLDSPECRRDQVEHNFQAVLRRRPEVTCHAYLQAFNLALAARRSSKRIEISAPAPSEAAG